MGCQISKSNRSIQKLHTEPIKQARKYKPYKDFQITLKPCFELPQQVESSSTGISSMLSIPKLPSKEEVKIRKISLLVPQEENDTEDDIELSVF